MVEHPGHGHFAADAHFLEQPGRNHHATLLVELGVCAAGEEVALHRPGLAAERVERADPGREDFEGCAGIDGQTAVQTTRDDDLAAKLLAKLRGKRETVLVVQGVFMVTEQHLPLLPTLTHSGPPVHP